MRNAAMLLTLSTMLSAGAPEVVDRVAVTVGNRAITESRIDEEIRVTAFLNGEKPVFDAETRRAAADRLVERILMRREIEITGFRAADSSGEMLEEIRGRYADGFAAALKEAGLTEDKLREGLSEQSRMLRFIDFRFRPAVTVSEEETRAYYEMDYPALWAVLHPGVPVPSLDEARDDVDRLLVDRKVDAQMDDWLRQAREQTRVVYHKEVFE